MKKNGVQEREEPRFLGIKEAVMGTEKCFSG